MRARIHHLSLRYIYMYIALLWHQVFEHMAIRGRIIDDDVDIHLSVVGSSELIHDDCASKVDAERTQVSICNYTMCIDVFYKEIPDQTRQICLGSSSLFLA